MASPHPIRKTTAPEIPDKLYFRIGDVAKLCEVAAYVLRFWETEFPQLKPNKGGTGQRLYRRKDVEIALRIKHLLYTQGFTIPGARQILKDELRHAGSEILQTAPLPPEASVIGESRSGDLATLRQEMQALHAMLSHPIAKGKQVVLQAGAEQAANALHTGKLTTMRPRLVATPGPVEVTSPGQCAVDAERAETAERMRLLQGDLFGGE